MLTLAGTADNASRKVKITLTGAVFQGTDDTEKVVTGTSISEKIVVDGSSDEVAVAFEAANVKITVPADVTSTTIGTASVNYTTKSYVGGTNVTGGSGSRYV